MLPFKTLKHFHLGEEEPTADTMKGPQSLKEHFVISGLPASFEYAVFTLNMKVLCSSPVLSHSSFQDLIWFFFPENSSSEVVVWDFIFVAQ